MEFLFAERLFASLADEVFGMPRFAECFRILSRDGMMARCATWAEEFVVILLTVWFSLPFVEAFSSKWLSTPGADKVFWMPLLAHRRRAISRNGTVATSASRAEKLVVVLFAIRFPIFFVETLALERPLAPGANEVFRMPLLAHRCRAVFFDWAVASGTSRAEKLVIVLFAIRFPTFFIEALAMQRLLASGANKVFRMPLLAHCRDGVS